MMYLTFRAKDIDKGRVMLISKQILAYLSNSFLPIPEYMDITGRKPIIISGYDDVSILNYAEKEFEGKKMAVCLEKNHSHFSVSFIPSHLEYVLMIKIPEQIINENNIAQYKSLFVDFCKILCPDIGICYCSESFHSIHDKHFEWEQRTSYFTFFSWLTYFGPEEFRKQGGDAIFSNPYIKAEKLGEGVLIQVGESPFDAATPEGEELIVKATRALPPVVK